MKIRIDLDESLSESEVVIRCPMMDETILAIQRSISEAMTQQVNITLYQGERECYLPIRTILFFETTNEGVCAHTGNEVYQTKYRLYELENLLPGFFMRVSKSTILNVNRIYSITKNLAASSVVQFDRSPKEVYVSRNYYKALKLKLEEKQQNRRMV